MDRSSAVSCSGRILGTVVELFRQLTRDLARDLLDPYRPELHYMRGPGPKWRAKHGMGSAIPIALPVRRGVDNRH